MHDEREFPGFLPVPPEWLSLLYARKRQLLRIRDEVLELNERMSQFVSYAFLAWRRVGDWSIHCRAMEQSVVVVVFCSTTTITPP